MRWFLLAATLIAGTPAVASAPDAGGAEASLDRALTPAEVVEWRIDRAVAQYGRGAFDDADRLLGLVIDSPGLADDLKALALFNRGAARLQLDRFAEAIQDFDAAEALSFPRPAQLHLARGIAWERLRLLDRAAHEYVAALSADPSDPSVRAKVRDFFYKP